MVAPPSAPGGAPESVEPRELALPDLDAVRLVVHRDVERDLAVAVAVEVPEPDVLRVRHLHGPGERLVRTDDPVEMEVGDGDVAGAVDLERQGEAAFAALLLGLERVDAPVRGVAELHLVAHVVLARHRVHPALGRGVRDQHAGRREGARRPDVEERPAAAVRDPEARVLAVPSPVRRRDRPSGCCCRDSLACRRGCSCRGRPGTARRSSSSPCRPSTSLPRRAG